MSHRGERAVALAALLVAGAAPAALYRHLLGQLMDGFALEFGFLVTGASGFALIALGLLCSLPVALSVGADPESRLYPRNRTALAGWGVSLYLMGLVLVAQIGAIAESV